MSAQSWFATTAFLFLASAAELFVVQSKSICSPKKTPKLPKLSTSDYEIIYEIIEFHIFRYTFITISLFSFHLSFCHHGYPVSQEQLLFRGPCIKTWTK